MKFYIEDVLIVFPYDYIYPEQLEYMKEMKRGLDAGGHMVLEMPSGTGKTITLLALLVAYLNHHRATERRKVVYCTRTVVEMTKTMEELRRLVKHWEKEDGVELEPLLGVCLSSRKNLCIEGTVSTLTYPSEVDAACRGMTAAWVENKCDFFTPASSGAVALPPGIHALDDIKAFGREHGACPYYLVRSAVANADIIVQSYLYLVDPKVSGMVTEHLSANTIVVMDEGHNVDDVCIEAMSMVITKANAQSAKEKNLKDLAASVERMKVTNRQRLQDEYDKLVNGLALSKMAGAASDTRVKAPTLPDQLANEAIPGALRQAEHFLSFLSRLTDFVARIISRMTRTQTADPLTFLTKVKEECAIDLKHLKFTSERLRVLLNTLQEPQAHNYRHIVLIADLFTTLAVHYQSDRYEKPGFVVICEPFDPSEPTIPDPVLRLACVDASLAVRDVFGKYRSVVLTSGTLSPLDIYPKVLGFTPVAARSFTMTLSRRCICPVIVTRTAEQQNLLSEEITSSFAVRMDAAAQSLVVNGYAMLLLELARTVPDGIVCFFTGYKYMSEVMLSWHNNGTLHELSKHKLIFVETQGVAETSAALANYRRACDIGRGAIFMSIARGKIAEGIDFDRHYGRAVVMFGVPFLPPTDEPLKERLRWMETCLSIPPSEFRNFDAMRQASQCIGRVLRNKTDYGMMLLVDRRFAMNDKRKKLPQWVQECLKENVNISVEAAVSVARTFFVQMAQPWDREKDLGTTLLDFASLVRAGHGEAQPPSILRAEDVADGGTSVSGSTRVTDRSGAAAAAALDAAVVDVDEEETAPLQAVAEDADPGLAKKRKRAGK